MATHHANSVSAIVCNYNYGDFIHETLESLARQTHRLQTLIIVDDGSDDLSRTVIDDFLAARGDMFDQCHFIRNEANELGKLACLNKALAFVDTRSFRSFSIRTISFPNTRSSRFSPIF